MPRNNEAEFKQTLQLLPVPAFVFDGVAHQFIGVNQLFCDLLGYAEEELKNLPWPCVLADDEEVKTAQQAIDSPQFNVPITFRGRHKNGSIVTSAIKYRDMKFVRDNGEVVAAFFAVVISSEGETAKGEIETLKS